MLVLGAGGVEPDTDMLASDMDGADIVGDMPMSAVESPEFKGGIPIFIEGI